jgi:invasion protein IalB
MARRGGMAFAGLVLVLAGAGFAVWNLMGSSSDEGPTSATFGYDAWLVRCQAAGDKVGCGMSQQVLDQGSRQSVLQLHLARAPKGDGHQLVAVLPLGVSVPQGILIQIGESKRNVAFTQCLPAGCVAPTAVDAAFLATLKSGKEGRIGVIGRTGKTVAVPFSLKGFGAAFEKMEERGGIANSDATWWNSFWNSSATK